MVQDESSDPNSSPERLRVLSKDKNEVIRRAVGKNPSTPTDVLMTLLDDEDSWLPWNLAQNPAATLELFDELIKRGRFLDQVGANKAAPVKVLTKLSKSKDFEVRKSVSLNPSTSVTTLAKLAKDSAIDVRKGVARNTSSTPEILESLADDEHEEVRRAVARNRNTPKPLKELLKASFQ